MRSLYPVLIMAGLLGCSSPTTQQTTQPTKPVAPSPTQPATAPELAVKDYLHWYAAHHDEFNANFITGGLDSTSFYAVDVTAANDWLARLGQSKHFSAAYVQGWRDYIGRYADTLRRHPQNDGPPEGFSYDLLLLSQEADTRLEELQKGTMQTNYSTKDIATVQARGQQHEGWREGLDFTLSRNKAGKWLIDSIEVPNNLVQ
jgi:hypothetical protein